MIIEESTPQDAFEAERERKRPAESRPTEVILMQSVPKFDPELVSEAKLFSAEFRTLYSESRR